MARGTAGTNTQISGTYTSHNGLTNFTLAGWVRRSSGSAASNFGFNESTTQRTVIVETSNTIYFTICNGNNTYGSVSNTLTGWNHYAMVFDGSKSTNSDKLLGYINGSQKTLTFSGTIPATISSNASNQTFRIGRGGASGIWSTADFAEIAWWDTSLSSSDINALFKGVCPSEVCLNNLLAYLPLIRNIQDVVSATTLTDQSTTVQPHPRIYK